MGNSHGMFENVESVQNIVDTVTNGLMDTIDKNRESRQQLFHEVANLKENLELVLKFIKISSQPKPKQPTSGQVGPPCLELPLSLPLPLPSSNSPVVSNVENTVKSSKIQHTPDVSKSNLQFGHFCSCGAKFISLTSLNAHIYFSTKKSKFFCPICPLRFVGLNHLKSHMKKIHIQCLWSYPESAVGCRKCGVVLPSWEEFRLHKKKVHGIPKKADTGIGKHVVKVKKSPRNLELDLLRKFPCSACGDRFKGLGDLRRHLLRVHKTKLRANIVGCRQCGKIFKSLSQLYSHRKTEHNKTDVVGKALKIKKRKKLGSHKRKNPQEVVTCTEEKPTAETEAEHSFNGFKLSLKTKKSTFLCRCRKQFSKQRHLDCHIKAMEKGRIFSCQLCQSTFYTMRMLRNHYRGKHNIDPLPCFGCRDCGQIFRNFTKLHKHKVENHEG